MEPAVGKDFSVAIVGGGMCGLACAISLARAGIDVKLFEAAAKFGEVGAGVFLGVNAVRTLKALDLLDPLFKVVDVDDANHESYRYVGATGSHEFICDNPPVIVKSNAERPFGIYRPTFIAALAPLLDPHLVFLGKRLKDISNLETGQYRLSFTDGSSHDADLVIGADGIKSTVRNSVVESGVGSDYVKFANTYVYRGVVSMAALKNAAVKTGIESRPHSWAGFEQQMVTFPVQKNTMLNVVFYTRTDRMGAPLSSEAPLPWTQSVEQRELLEKCQDWGDDAYKILKAITQPSRWDLHTLYPPLPSYVRGRIVLIGDAAHAMLPYLGAGVGQGLEDVLAITRLLAHPNVRKETLETAIVSYDNLRPPRANMILQKSLTISGYIQVYGKNGKYAEQMKPGLQEQFSTKGWWGDLLYHDLEAEISRVMQHL